MSQSYQKWITQKIEKLQTIDCYSAGVTPEGLATQIGVSPQDIVKLNFNENLFVDRAKQVPLIKELADEIDLRMYPEDEVPKLVEKLTTYMGVPKDYLVIGNAGDELIDRIIRLFIEKGDAAVSPSPTFAIPRLCVKRQEGEYVTVPLTKDFQLDVLACCRSSRENQITLHLLTQQPHLQPNETRGHRNISQSLPRHSHIG